MRSFAGFYFILRYLLLIIILSLEETSTPQFTIISITFTASAIVIALTRPYKKTYMNIFDTILLSLIGVLFHLLSTDNLYMH